MVFPCPDAIDLRAMENELKPEMRHVPPLDELIGRVDVRLRKIVDTLYSAAFHASHEGTPETMKQIEAQFERVILWMDRLCEFARHSKRQPQRDGALVARLHHELDSAVAALRSLDPATFRRCASYHSFDKSNAEPIYSTVLALGDITWRIGELVATFDPHVFMKVYDQILDTPPPPVLVEGRPIGRTV
jgi:hypothetical protein